MIGTAPLGTRANSLTPEAHSVNLGHSNHAAEDLKVTVSGGIGLENTEIEKLSRRAANVRGVMR